MAWLVAGPGPGWVGERAEPPMRILTLLAPTASVTALLVITISLSVSPAGAGPPLSPGCLLGRARGSVLLPENERPGCGNLQQVECHHLGVSRRVPDMHAVFDDV